ncbi:hypothetical protein [Peribacillus simplex]|uniref:hypothetical protein n=1 Tax=Peribacillus simplex TaxID=1478 RepID=UPI0011AA55B3|nr:hypothetical protein [Peribacillus simplex]
MPEIVDIFQKSQIKCRNRRYNPKIADITPETADITPETADITPETADITPPESAENRRYNPKIADKMPKPEIYSKIAKH